MTKFCIGAALLSMVAMPASAAVVVVGGKTAVASFVLPGGTPYQVDFPNGPGTPTLVWFDSAMTNPVVPFTTYAATSRGDFNADNILDGRDVQGFADALVLGVFNAEADFDDNGNVDVGDIAGFVEALLLGLPADGVILFVEGINASTAIGDATIDLYLDPDQDLTFTLSNSEPVTSFEFTVQANGQIGAPSAITIAPAIAPYIFDANTSARWAGTLLTSAGSHPPLAVDFSSSEVQEQSSNTAVIILGQGSRSGGIQTDLIPLMTGFSRGRLTLSIAGEALTTPEFDIDHSGQQFRFNELDFDPVDPGGVAPDYGVSVDPVPVLNVTDPVDPGLDTLWGFHVALEVPVDENADSLAVAPATISVDLLVIDAAGQVHDSIANLMLDRIDADGDPAAINYRSDLVRPLIFVDAAVNELAFPDLHVVQVVAGSSVTIVPR
jgi:hypothetical protein